MNFWTAVVVIVSLGCLTGSYRIYLEHKRRGHDGRTSGNIGELEKRLKGLEARMANIETLILDKEKTDRFNDLK